MDRIQIKEYEPILRLYYKCKVCYHSGYNEYDEIDYYNNLIKYARCDKCGEKEDYDKKIIDKINKFFNKKYSGYLFK